MARTAGLGGVTTNAGPPLNGFNVNHSVVASNGLGVTPWAGERNAHNFPLDLA